MPRRHRIALDGFPLHIIQRGNNRAACFFSDADRGAYLYWLKRYAERFGICIHAWVLMTNHVHLLVTPGAAGAASRAVQALGRRYVRHVNRAHSRTGTLWEGRFRACAVHADEYLLRCMRYIELNPVRAGTVKEPGAYRWSSYRRNALGYEDQLVSPHPLYAALAPSEEARRSAYRALFDAPMDAPILAHIRAATAAGYLLAGDHVTKAVETAEGRRLGPAPRGRPRKKLEKLGSESNNDTRA